MEWETKTKFHLPKSLSLINLHCVRVTFRGRQNCHTTLTYLVCTERKMKKKNGTSKPFFTFEPIIENRKENYVDMRKNEANVWFSTRKFFDLHLNRIRLKCKWVEHRHKDDESLWHESKLKMRLLSSVASKNDLSTDTWYTLCVKSFHM